MTSFVTSDTHFGHKNILGFKRSDGSPLRPFKTIDEHDDILVDNWNSVVKQEDKIYHLGDVTFASNLNIMKRLNGHKILIKGNHDKLKPKEYLKYFSDIRAMARITQDESYDFSLCMTHIPLHPSCINPRFGYNIHGHLHANNLNDMHYINVCVEHTFFTPVAIETIRDQLKKAIDCAKIATLNKAFELIL